MVIPWNGIKMCVWSEKRMVLFSITWCWVNNKTFGINYSFKSYQSHMFIVFTTVWIWSFLSQLRPGCGFLCKEFSHVIFLRCFVYLCSLAHYRSLCQPRRVIPEAQFHNTDRGYWGRRAALSTWQPPSLHKHKEMIGLKNRMKVLITWPKAQKPQCYVPSVQIRIIVFCLTVVRNRRGRFCFSERFLVHSVTEYLCLW